MNFALGIFAKAPIPGQVKTRLCPPLTPEQAAEFYTLCLAETITRAAQSGCEAVLFYSGDEAFFRAHYPALRRLPQQGPDLGARMKTALHTLLAEGFDAAVLIGTDTPDLPLTLIAEATESLQQHDVVIAPSSDGGYVLLGERRHHPELFDDIPWSTSRVLPATRARAALHGIALCEITPWEDIDEAADLRRFIERSPASPCALLATKLLP